MILPMKYEQAYVLAITHFIESRQLYGLPCIMCGIGRSSYFAAVLSFCKTERESNETLSHARNEPDLKMVVKMWGPTPSNVGPKLLVFECVYRRHRDLSANIFERKELSTNGKRWTAEIVANVHSLPRLLLPACSQGRSPNANHSTFDTAELSQISKCKIWEFNYLS